MDLSKIDQNKPEMTVIKNSVILLYNKNYKKISCDDFNKIITNNIYSFIYLSVYKFITVYLLILAQQLANAVSRLYII